MSNFRPVDRETGFLLPPSVEEWLPERHLARFVVEVIEQLDLSGLCQVNRIHSEIPVNRRWLLYAISMA